MALRLQFNTGFVTNSSSCVHFFNKKDILENPSAMAYIRMIGLDKVACGYFGADYLCRSQGDAVIWSESAVEDAREYDRDGEYGCHEDIPVGDVVLVLASSEVETFAQRFWSMMQSLGITAHSMEERH